MTATNGRPVDRGGSAGEPESGATASGAGGRRAAGDAAVVRRGGEAEAATSSASAGEQEGGTATRATAAPEAAANGGPAAPANGGPAAPASAPGAERADTVAAVVGQWQAVHPELDTGPMEIIGRINRCAALLQQAEDAPLRRAGLSRPEFDLLGALRRTGHELTPSELARETFSSGAAVTKRLKQLTERGLVERRGDTRDRRVAHVRLTDAGRDLVDGILPEQLAYETAVLSGLDPTGQGELALLLSELLGRLEGRPGVLRV
jgi:DNA-binding MarR family transcriptional regulator